MSNRIVRGALLLAAATLIAPSVLVAADQADVVNSLKSARTALTQSATDSKAQLEALADRLTLDTANDNSVLRRQVQYVAVQLSIGRVSDASASLDALIDEASEDADRAHGGGHPGAGHPQPHPGHPEPHPGHPEPHPSHPEPHPGHPGFPPGHPGWEHGGHHWDHPPHWWHVIPVPVIVPVGAITYNEGYNYGYNLGHYDGWDNFPYNTSQDPYFAMRPPSFQQGYLAGYRLGYQRGQLGQ